MLAILGAILIAPVFAILAVAIGLHKIVIIRRSGAADRRDGDE